MRKIAGFACLLLALAATGCSSFKTTTTARAATEQGLLSTAAERALAGQVAPEMPYKRVFMDVSEFKGVDSEFALSALRLRLVEQGYRVVAKEDEADLVVYPRSAVAGIDESTFLIGIPALPIPIPGAGVVTTPEIALFKRFKQIGLARLGAYAVDRDARNLVFDMKTSSGKAYHTRWVILLVGFNKTDMGEPFRKVKPKTEEKAKPEEKKDAAAPAKK